MVLSLTNRQIAVQKGIVGDRICFTHPEFTLTARILRWHFQKEGRVILELQAAACPESILLILVPREAEYIGNERALLWKSLSQWGKKALEVTFPEFQWRSFRFCRNYSGLFPSNYVLFRNGKAGRRFWAVVLGSGPPLEEIYRILPMVLRDVVRQKNNPISSELPGLIVVSPLGISARIFRLLELMKRSGFQWQIYAYKNRKTLLLKPLHREAPWEVRDLGASRWPPGAPWFRNAMIDRIAAAFPSGFRRFPRADGGFSFRYLGLEVARSSPPEEATIRFGLPDLSRELNENSWGDFVESVRQIQRIRCPASPDPHHPYYLRQTERWLEELLLCQIQVLDPELDERFVYPQVPAYWRGRKGAVDLLAITRRGRLAVIEIKVQRDSGLLFQALDYWDRVHRHNLENDFEKRGFFPGFSPGKEEPLLYLVAPVLSFHPGLECQAKWLSGEMEVYKIGLHGSWRRRLSVAFRKRIYP